MSAPAAADGAPAKKGLPKKLLLIVIVLVVLLLGGGGAAVFMMKKKAAEAAAAAEGGEDAEAHAEPAAAHGAPKTPPTFSPLDNFTVNLADKDAERYAQIGITLELADAKYAEELKTYMPAVRSSLLMLLSHKTSAEMLGREGKEKLAREIARETSTAMGYEVDDEDDEDEAEDSPKKKKKKKKRRPEGPIRQVLFSNFIVQ